MFESEPLFSSFEPMSFDEFEEMSRTDDEPMTQPSQFQPQPSKLFQESFSQDQLLDRISQLITTTCEVTGFSRSLSFLLLLRYAYDVENLLERFAELGTRIVLDHISIDPNIIHNPPTAPTNKECFACGLPLTATSSHVTTSETYYMLDCGHGADEECWAAYLESQVNASNSIEIPCILMGQCGLIADPDFVLSFLSGELQSKYIYYLVNDFVFRSSQYTFCPGKGCGHVILKGDPTPSYLSCPSCELRFCPRCCFAEDHRPAECSDVKQWEDRGALDKHTSSWLKLNTKPCPQCSKLIEKNGGCLHMSCTQCRYEFCWACSGDWKTHGDHYKCSKFKEDSENDKRKMNKEAMQLKRFHHCHDRFIIHSQGFEHESKLKIDLKEKINDLFRKEDALLQDCSFIYDAIDVLLAGRLHLKWSYVFVYALENEDERHLFEFRQGKLEATVDKISEFLTKDIDTLIDERVSLDRLRFVAIDQLDNLMRK
ncbi:hypothetical protein P9112_001661 [Eukaryota sp. TZLM1-RC]